MIWDRRRTKVVLALVAGLITFDAPAAENLWKDTLQFHGFASQGYIWTSDNNFFGNSKDNGTFDFRELGINGSVRPLPRLQLSAQLLSRRAGEGDDGDIRLDYGFLDYSIVSNANNLFGVRGGRILNPLGLYNETRDVAFTRPTILLPQSIYFDRTRNLALSADGGQLYGEHRTKFGDFHAQLGVVVPRAHEPDVERSLLGGDFPGETEGNTSLIGRLLYEKSGGAVRLALSGAMVNIDYSPGGLADPLPPGSIDFDPLVLSAQYNAERLSLTSEYALRDFASEGFGGPPKSFTGESYYFQAAYRFATNWEAVVRYDVLYSDRDDRDGRKFETATGLPAYTRFAKDITVGVRWDITSWAMLRAEYHHVNGTGWLPLEDNPDPLALKRHWDLLSVLVSFRY